MNFASPNRADNISIADATAFLAKMTKLGIFAGPLHLDATEGVGGTETSYWPLDEATATEGFDPAGKYNCIFYSNGNWHQVAEMVTLWGTGGSQGFRRVFQAIRPGGDADSALMNIPGVGKAIDALIQKA